MKLPRILLVLACLAAGCNSNGENDVPDYDPEDDISYPDTHIAWIPAGGGREYNPPIVCFNATHSRYLKREEGEAIPKYVHPHFSRQPLTAKGWLPNAAMKSLVEDILVPAGLYQVATSIDPGTMVERGWPPRAALLFEQGDRLLVVYDPLERLPNGKAVNKQIPPKDIPASKLLAVAKQCLAAAVTDYPGVSQMTERGASSEPVPNPQKR